MQTLDSVSTSNDYTNATTIQQVFNSAGGYGIVSGADAYVELQYMQHGPGSEQWTNEVHVPLNSPLTLLPGTTGIRFRSYKAGTPATVSAALAGEAEPPITLTNPGTVNVSGASTNYDHNGAFVGLEPSLNLIDAGMFTWVVFDNGANTRVDVTPPKMLYGVITAAGAITVGTGFTVNRTGVGLYTVNYSVAFSAQPVVLPGALMDTFVVLTNTQSSASFSITTQNLSSVNTDTRWSFLAVGPL